MTNPKQKDTPEQPPMLLALKPIGDSAHLTRGIVGGHLSDSERQLLTVLRGFGDAGATKTELQAASGQAQGTFYRTVNALVGKRHIHKTKQGRSTVYTLAADSPDGLISVASTSTTEIAGDLAPEATGTTSTNESHNGEPALTSTDTTSTTSTNSPDGKGSTFHTPLGVERVEPVGTSPLEPGAIHTKTNATPRHGAAAKEGTP